MARIQKCEPEIRYKTAYDHHERVTFQQPDGEGRTEQHHAESCDINMIMARYQRTGAIDHFKEHGGRYGDFTSCDYHEAMNLVADAQSMFEDLPSSIRDRFKNDPSRFLDFVQDPKNADEMIEMGLAHQPERVVELDPPAEKNDQTANKQTDSE